MLLATPVVGVAVVALHLQHIALAHAALGATGQHGVAVDLVQRDGAVLEADGAGQQVALVLAVAQARGQLAVVVKAVDVAQRDVLRRRVVVVAGQTVVLAGFQWHVDLAVGREAPGVVVERAALGFEVVQPDGELIARADAPGKRGCNAALVLLGTVVVVLLHHGVQAEGRVLARHPVEVAGGAVVLAGAQRVAGFVLVDQQRVLVDLVDHAAGRALAEQHGGRALEHFDAVVVEGVALDQRGVLHAVHIDVARQAQREAAQAHVFFTGLAGLEGHARRGAQHFAEVVLVAVVHQLFGEHRHGLGDVLDVLLALAHGGLLDEQGVLALDFGGFLHRHGGQGGFWRAGLRHGAHRGGQHQRAQWQQGPVGLRSLGRQGGGRSNECGRRTQHAAAALGARFSQEGLRQ